MFGEIENLGTEGVDSIKSKHSSKKFTKLKDFCWKARDRGLDWCWIDTCCIDKKSSADLSESINSMYEWYRQADECYVYLADVTGLETGQKGAAKSGVINAQGDGLASGSTQKFEDSAWFSRGWTLQELLAPNIVRFYDSSWRFLGTKVQRSSDISRRTGIAEKYLKENGEPLASMASVATKMSWAASRRTTRLEDRAYCLLGIFEVNMPLLYGEGVRAFYRLQAEILKTCNDESIFAWVSDTPGYSGDNTMLASSPRLFKQSGKIRSDDITSAWRKPLIMTNKGLEMSIPERYLENAGLGRKRNIRIIPLACKNMAQPEDALFMYVRHLYYDDDGAAPVFRRYHPDEAEILEFSERMRSCKLHVLKWELRGPCKTVYITQ